MVHAQIWQSSVSLLIDVLPSVVINHKLQKPLKLSGFLLYFCQRFYIKKRQKNKKPWKRKNVAIIKKRIKHFFYIRGYNDTLRCYRTRPINYGRVGLDALKMPSVAHVTFAFYTHFRTSFRFFDFRSLYMTIFAFSYFRILYVPCTGAWHMFKARSSSPAAAGLVLPSSE